jgi:hypothetical protein
MRLPGNELHFVVKALGDGVVRREALRQKRGQDPDPVTLIALATTAKTVARIAGAVVHPVLAQSNELIMHQGSLIL